MGTTDERLLLIWGGTLPLLWPATGRNIRELQSFLGVNEWKSHSYWWDLSASCAHNNRRGEGISKIGTSMLLGNQHGLEG